MTLPSSLLATAVAAALVAFVLTLARGSTSLAPLWLDPPHGPRWALAGLVILFTGALASAFGLDVVAGLSAALGMARQGPWGAVATLAVGLAALLLVGLGLRLVVPERASSRAPGGGLALLFGVAPDGTALESVRRPLRAGLAGLIGALVLALPLASEPSSPLSRAPLLWALALVAVTGARLALTRPTTLTPAAAAPVPAETAPDAQLAFHARLGSPPLFEREQAVTADDRFFHAITSAFADPGPHLVVAAAPPGAGKRRAARALAEAHAARGLVTLWLTDHAADHPPGHAGPILGVQTISLAGLTTALERAARFPRLGLVVVDGRAAATGQALAILRYGLHRLFSRERLAPDVLLLSSAAPDSARAIARAIGAAEPHLVTPDGPLATAPIARYLLAAPPDPTLARAAPADVSFVALDRPRPLARHPGARGLMREYLIPSGGPRGRRMQEDRARSLVRGRASRLLVALPGDRASPPGQDSLARLHLRAALAEAPQDPRRLRAVFSPGLVDAELAALARAGLVTEVAGWVPAPASSHGLVSTPRVTARIPRAELEPPATVALVEPRSGRERRVLASRAAWDAFDGAITTLDDDPAGARHEVRVGHAPDQRVLVPTALVAATPIRKLTTRLLEAPRKARLRLRGAREIEVWEGRVAIGGLHLGVRQFDAASDLRGPEARSLTRLLPEPVPLPPLHTDARALVLTGADLPSAAALHAMAHALGEVLPCLVDNADDLGVTFSLPPELPGPALVLYDKHPEGLGAVLDLRDDDLEALLSAACELLECDCAAHCAACCESTACTLDPAGDVGLDRVQALAILSAVVRPRPLPLHAPPMPLRRTG